MTCYLQLVLNPWETVAVCSWPFDLTWTLSRQEPHYTRHCSAQSHSYHHQLTLRGICNGLFTVKVAIYVCRLRWGWVRAVQISNTRWQHYRFRCIWTHAEIITSDIQHMTQVCGELSGTFILSIRRMQNQLLIFRLFAPPSAAELLTTHGALNSATLTCAAAPVTCDVTSCFPRVCRRCCEQGKAGCGAR